MAKLPSLRGAVASLMPQQLLANCKRTIFMTSLYLKLCSVKDASVRDLEDCNRRLGLVNNAGALKFPAAFGESFWKADVKDTICVEEDLCSTNLTSICQKVISITPKWLRYGNELEQMKQDIVCVARSLPVQRHAV